MRRKFVKGRTGFKLDSKGFLNQVPIYDGKGVIYTTPDSNGNYYFRTWIAEESKYYRKGLFTKLKNEAKRKGEDEMLDILTKLKNGHKIFGMSWGELCESFLIHSQDRVDTKRITPARLLTLKTQTNKWIIPYLNKSTRLSEINIHSFMDYGMYRRKETKNQVQDVTIRNEYTTINSIIKHGFRMGETPIQRCEVEEIKITDPARRDTFTPEEYKEFYMGIRDWVKDSYDAHETYMRSLVRDFILIKSNSFLRFGEMINLKWGMIKITSHKGKRLVSINLPSDITKNNKNREVICRGGRYFERIKEYTEQHRTEDFIFTLKNDSKRIAKTTMYKYWKQILSFTKFDRHKKQYTYYSLRHFGITARLYAKVPIYEVAKLAGTNVKFIEQHYEHLDMGKLKDSALQSFTIDADGFVIRE